VIKGVKGKLGTYLPILCFAIIFLPPPQVLAAELSVLPEGTAKEQYRYAFGLLRQYNYDKAELAFQEFVKSRPRDNLVNQARYWLGETYYVRAAYVQAAEVFLEGYRSDPKGEKAPDSMLKLGMSLVGLGKNREGCAAFRKMITDYPRMSFRLQSMVNLEKRKSCNSNFGSTASIGRDYLLADLRDDQICQNSRTFGGPLSEWQIDSADEFKRRGLSPEKCGLDAGDFSTSMTSEQSIKGDPQISASNLKQSCDKKPIYYEKMNGAAVFGEIDGRLIYNPEELCRAESPEGRAKAAEERAKAAKERAHKLAEEAKRARASEKGAAEAGARQAKIDAQRLKKLAAEAKFAEAEARQKAAEATSAEAGARAKLEAAKKVANQAETQRIAKLEAERRLKETEADEAYRKRLESLVVGLRAENAFMDVAILSANIRNLPTRKGAVIKGLPNGTQVHVVSVLPSGWVQIAEEGEPIGWLHRAALRPSARSPGVAARQSPPSPSVLFATNYPFPVGKPNHDAVAVIIGNRSYQHPDIPEVSFAYNDVEAIRQYVIKTRGFSERNVFVVKDATKANLEGYFGSRYSHRGRLFNAVRSGKSDVFVYFSGHGVPGEDKIGYLFPTDGDPTQAELTGYSIQTLVDNLAKVPARSLVVALDTCFSGVSQAGALIPAASPIYLKAKIPSAGPNSVILTAATGSQISSWDTGAQLGLFTRHLLEGMIGKADSRGGNKDGKVQLAELQSYMLSEVAYQARRRYSRDQTPEILGSPEFVLANVTDNSFPGFGDPDATGTLPTVQRRYASPELSPKKEEPKKEEEGFTLFGIKIVPSKDGKGFTTAD